jgi:hypothetical protein
MTISRWIPLRTKNVLDKSCRENQNTRFMPSNFFPENRTVNEILSKNMTEPGRPQTNWRMRVACCINAQAHARAPTATHACAHPRAHTQKYVIFIAFSKATMVSWTRLNVNVTRTSPVLSNLELRALLLLLFSPFKWRPVFFAVHT